MGFYAYLKETDKQIADDYAASPRYFCLSPTRYALTEALFPIARTVLSGRCLDAGAGRMAYQQMLRGLVDDYIAMDIQHRPGLEVAGSALALPFADAAFDSVFCSQVLEHVPDPEQALREFARCLKPGGVLLLSTPHLAYLHNEPHDYFRYTNHGLRALCERAGLVVESIDPAGGLLSFLGHIPSMIAKALFYPIPGLGPLVVWLNQFSTRFVVWLDHHLDKKKLFALNFIAVTKKPKQS